MFTHLIASSVCLAVFYGCYHFLFQKETFFQRNRYYLLLTSVVAVLLPFLEIPFTEESQEITPILTTDYVQDFQYVVNETEAQIQTQFIDYELVALGVYALIVLLFFVSFVWKFSNIIHVLGNYPIKNKGNYKLIQTGGKLPTFSFLTYLFWDETQILTSQQAEKILQHEITHIRDKHSYDLLWVELLKIFFWFNPVVYFYKKALQDQHEFIADQSVLKNSDVRSYAKLLVNTFFTEMNLSYTHSFNQLQIQKRLKMMKKNKTSKISQFKLVALLPVLMGLFLTFGCENHPLSELADADELTIMDEQNQVKGTIELKSTSQEELLALIEKYNIDLEGIETINVIKNEDGTKHFVIKADLDKSISNISQKNGKIIVKEDGKKTVFAHNKDGEAVWTNKGDEHIKIVKKEEGDVLVTEEEIEALKDKKQIALQVDKVGENGETKSETINIVMRAEDAVTEETLTDAIKSVDMVRKQPKEGIPKMMMHFDSYMAVHKDEVPTGLAKTRAFVWFTLNKEGYIDKVYVPKDSTSSSGSDIFDEFAMKVVKSYQKEWQFDGNTEKKGFLNINFDRSKY